MQSPALTAVGRIVAASLAAFETECFQGEAAPPLGALVVTLDGDPAVYGAVSASVTQGIDPSRPIAPHGGADEDLATVLSRNPHLPVLLRTTFSATVVGHETGGGIRQLLPEAPPPLVARVRLCTAGEQRRFVQRLDFLEQLVGAGTGADEVTAAFLRRAARAQADPHGFLLEAGRALVPLLAREPGRLASIVRQMRPEP